MSYNILGRDDENLRVEIVEGDVTTINIQPASFTDLSFIGATEEYVDLGDAATLAQAQAYTDTAVADLVDSAPGTLDTLNELAQALGDDPNFATSITTTIAAGDAQSLADANTYTDSAIASAVSAIDIPATTDDISEGANLYYTDARVQTVIDTNTAGFITDYTVTESDVTQHQSALSITESQISDLAHYDRFDADFAAKGAQDLSYDNTDSTLAATTVKSAIDELDLEKVNVADMAASVRLYPTDTPDATGYYQAVNSIDDARYDTTPVDISTGEITANDQLVGAVISDAGLITGNPGHINVTTIGNVRKTAGGVGHKSAFYFTIVHRTDAGVETVMGTSSNTINEENTSYQEFFADCLLTNPQTFTETDRIVIKYYSNNVSGSPTYEFQFGGITPVRTNLPVQVSLVASNQDADEVLVDTTNFNNNLSASDTTVQAALDTLDNLTVSASFDGDLAGSDLTDSTGPVDITSVSDINLKFSSATGNIRLENTNPTFQASVPLNTWSYSPANIIAGFDVLTPAANRGVRMQFEGTDGSHNTVLRMFGENNTIRSSRNDQSFNALTVDASKLIVNGDVDTNSVVTNQIKMAGAELQIRDSNNNRLVEIGADDFSTRSDFGGSIRLRTNSNDVVIATSLDQNLGVVDVMGGGAITLDGAINDTTEFGITHGVTLQSHGGTLGLTVDRDQIYTGKPFQVFPVNITPPASPNEGEFYYDDVNNRLQTFRYGSWIDMYEERTGLLFYNTTTGRPQLYTGSEWKSILTNDSTLDEISNVNSLITPTDGQALVWNDTDGVWEPGTINGGGGGASSLTDLTDVTVTAPSDGDILRYSGVAGEFQNTNLGLSLTPTIDYSASQFLGQNSSVTITNWGDYDDPNAWAQIVDSNDNVVVSASQITDNNDGTLDIPGISTAGSGYKLQVKVQDFGDLASDTAEQTFDVVQLFGWTTRYIKIGNFTTNNDLNDLIYSNFRFYTGAGQTGTALPGNMTSATTPAPFVITSSDTGYSDSYAPWTAFDAAPGAQFWTLGTSSSAADTWIVIDLGAEYTINSMSVRTGSFASDVTNGFTLYTSDTGAFAGEEVQREILTHSDVASTITNFN